jgi:hypothetical protein
MNARKRIGMKEEDGCIGGQGEEEEECKGNKHTERIENDKLMMKKD